MSLINRADSVGRTLLHHAVIGEFSETTVEVLLDKKASFDIADKRGRTPLEYAAMASPNIVNTILRYGDDPARRATVTAWQYALFYDQEDAFEMLYWQICELDNRLERFTKWNGPDGIFPAAWDRLLSEISEHALLRSENEQHRDRMNMIQGAPLAVQHSGALEWTFAYSALAVIGSVPIESHFWTTLWFAAFLRHVVFTDNSWFFNNLMREANLPLAVQRESFGSRLSRFGQALLHCSAANGHDAPIPFITNILGVNINCRDQAGKTALHKSAERGHLTVVARLIQSGAATSVEDNDGRMPMFYARNAYHNDVVHYLEHLKDDE